MLWLGIPRPYPGLKSYSKLSPMSSLLKSLSLTLLHLLKHHWLLRHMLCDTKTKVISTLVPGVCATK